jgi:hypothetical protein
MYLTTSERLGRILLPIGFFFVPPKIQAFLDRVRNSPKSFEPLLLTVELHQDPLKGIGPTDELFDLIMNITTPSTRGTVGKMALGALKTILIQHKKDPQFQRQVQAEFNLGRQLEQTAEKLPHQKLEPFLLSAWLDEDASLTSIGRNLAARMLPRLHQMIIQSKVPNTHFFNLGRFLRQLFEGKEGAFKSRAELELRKALIKKLRADIVHNPEELKPLLVEAALASEADQLKVGAEWAKNRVPFSRSFKLASESHFGYDHFRVLGEELKVHANRLRRRPDGAFDRLVKQEIQRRLSKQKQSEQMRRP